MRAALVISLILTATNAWSGPKQKSPASLIQAAKLIDGAKRISGTKTCTFSASAQGCTLKVKTSCERKLASSKIEYWYSADIPVGMLDPARTLATADAGGHTGTHGIEFALKGAKFPVVTDTGDRSEQSSGVIGFAQGKGAASKAQKAVKLLLAAQKACR